MITYHYIVYIDIFVPSFNHYCFQCINVVHPTLKKLYEKRIQITNQNKY
jgi:hypothetical protein